MKRSTAEFNTAMAAEAYNQSTGSAENYDAEFQTAEESSGHRRAGRGMNCAENGLVFACRNLVNYNQQ